VSEDHVPAEAGFIAEFDLPTPLDDLANQPL
jgi:hypothetical protein